jgi:alpha-tubulin suppressor-like RCC1 family protein
VTTDGKLKEWVQGIAKDENIPTVTTTSLVEQSIVQVTSGWLDHFAAVASNGHLYTWGVNSSGKLGRWLCEFTKTG